MGSKHRRVKLPATAQTEYRKILGLILLDEGATYDKIHEITGLARTTISGLKKGRVKTHSALTAAVKKQENQQLAEIGLLSRAVTKRRLLRAIESDDGSIPMSQIQKVQEVAFNQRRTLEGEASIIYDYAGTSDRIDARTARIAELNAKRRELLLRRGPGGVYEAEGGE